MTRPLPIESLCASAPSMTVNPLSALAPGILRRFIDPFGGSPQGGRSAGQQNRQD